MKFRKPQFIPLLFIVGATLLFCGLGTWQLQRLAWKNDIIAEMAQKEQMPILGTLPQSLDGLEYRHVALTGTFAYDKALHLIGRQQGADVGYFMLTPFTLDDDGRVILVNRGFAPPGKEAKPQGLQTVHGIIRPARAKRFFAPENMPQKNVWFYEDFDAISQATMLAITPLIVEATGEAKPNEYPIPGDGKIVLRNDHLHYAITWFLLAVIGLVMFAVYHRKAEE